MEADAAAPKTWQGRFFEDFDVGDVFSSRSGRTVTDTDNIWFTALTMNTNPLHFDQEFASGTRWGKLLMNSTFTLAVITGLTVADTSEHAAANLEWSEIKLPNPVFAGDTLYAQSEILEKRESRSNPDVGIIKMRTRGLNQSGEVVCEFRRSFMIYKRDAPGAKPTFPTPQADWTV
jgi:itaconyl-CoA hydratase